MTTQEVMLLVKQHLARTVRDPIHILQVVPEKNNGWGVLIEYDGWIWKQIVDAGGKFGDLTLQPSVQTAA